MRIIDLFRRIDKWVEGEAPVSLLIMIAVLTGFSLMMLAGLIAWAIR